MASYPVAAMSTSTMIMVLLLLINYSHCFHAAYTDKDGADQEEIAAPTCKSYECPVYMSVHKDKEFEIRRYINHTLWISSSDINVNNSFRQTTRAGFLGLLHYIKGNNGKHEEIPVTAPVLTEVFLSSRGPSCDTAFVVRLSVAKSFEEVVENDNLNNQSLHAESWNGWCAAVRKFGGFATKANIVEEAQSLKTSLLATPWAGSLNNTTDNSDKCLDNEEASIFQVAQYNSPFGNKTRFNEIWFVWDSSIESNCSFA
jgi:hypothetical protein